ncbi:hypothetical protein [Xanthomonas phage L522]|nr:hypothetical protein [Xanthomonas phage L522]
MLTFDEVDKLLSYDPETGLLTWKINRSNVKAGSVAGSLSHYRYLDVRLHSKLYKAHRLAWLLHTGAWPTDHIDHIDGCRTNNRISNLRECSNAENRQNQKRRSDNTSGVPGVGWHKQAGKWAARIRVNGKTISLGLFDSIEEAAAARAAAKAQYHPFQPIDRETQA